MSTKELEDNSDLLQYESDFISFHSNISKLRITNPDQFVAFAKGQILGAGNSMQEIKDLLSSKGIEPSGTVIDFVAKDEIRMII